MTVKELIEHLQGFEPDTPVLLGISNDGDEDLADPVYSVGIGHFFESQYGDTKLLVDENGTMPEFLPEQVDEDFKPEEGEKPVKCALIWAEN